MQKRHPPSKEGPPVTTKFQSLSKISFFGSHHHAVLKCTASSALHIWGKKSSVFTLPKGSFVSNGTMLASYTILTVAFCRSECCVLQDVQYLTEAITTVKDSMCCLVLLSPLIILKELKLVGDSEAFPHLCLLLYAIF